MTINIADIITEYGAYYEKGGQNEKDLIKFIKQPTETEDLFPLGLATVGPNASTKVKKATVETDRVLQPYQTAFTPIGNVTFEPREIDLFRLKIDLQTKPDDLHNSWLAFLTSNNLDRATWPFVKYLAMELTTKQHKQDRELNEIFKGVYAAPTTGTAGAVSTAMNGIRKQIRDLYATGDTAVQVLGAPPTDPEDFCDYVEAFVAGIPDLVKIYGGTIAMSKTLADRYREGKRLKYNQQYQQVEQLLTVMYNENFMVKGLASHAGSTMIWFSPNFNKNRFMAASENENIFKIGEYAPRVLSMYTDYWMGVGFWVPQYLYHNDQDL